MQRVFFRKQYKLLVMERIKTFLFKEPALPFAYSIILLVVRIIFGILFLSHGVAKWTAFNDATENFPDPLSLGSTVTFWLAIFAEVACSFGFMLGALFRLSLIPMIFTMFIAVFVIHAGDPLAVKELALMYLTIFVLTFFSGPGRISIDGLLRKIMS